MLSSSKFVVGSSRVKIPQFRQNVSASCQFLSISFLQTLCLLFVRCYFAFLASLIIRLAQGKLIQTRWIDTDLVDCFSCLYRWQLAPTNTIAGLFELYQQLVPTKLYNQNKTRTDTTSDAMCRMCHESPESVAHVIAGCSALAQTKYVARHNGALKILIFWAYWKRPTMVLTNNTETRVPQHQSKRILGCTSICRKYGSKSQPNRCQDSWKGDRNSKDHRDELPLDRKQEAEESRKDHQICTLKMGTQTTAQGLHHQAI